MNEEKKYKTLIVDDEKYARGDLRELLSLFPTIEVVGEAKNIKTAIEAIEKLKPDLIFLDIQFPGETGFELFDKVDINAKVIFVTAYDEYAIRAFDVNACDYLLKPVNPDRLALAVKRIQENRERQIPPGISLTEEDSIYLQLNYKYYFIRVDSIIKITAADHFTEIITAKGLKGLTNKQLCEWDECLPKSSFIKVHRSTIINMNFVERIERGANYSYHIIMKNIEEPIAISRRYASQIKKKMTP
ncbi:MAG: LytTR family DNA-binding domain-containing protein [Ignavibacteria bacterium]|nr:LytTR family DNA-binding domain-containing protein [Ignavibacteria bacterium]